jgi:hypothetical protein
MTARGGQEAAVTETTLAGTTVAEVMAELAELEDPKTREVNEKHGDDHGVNLSKLRALAKRLKTQQELACQLWRPMTPRSGSSTSSPSSAAGGSPASTCSSCWSRLARRRAALVPGPGPSGLLG